MWIKDPKTQEKSVTVTLLVSTFVVALLKLVIADVSLHGITVGSFTGNDFAAVVGAVGALYGFRKHTDKGKDK